MNNLTKARLLTSALVATILTGGLPTFADPFGRLDPWELSPNGGTSPTAIAVSAPSVSLSVTGASQTGVTGNNSWAAVEASTGNVTITATISPVSRNNQTTGAEIKWIGGQAVTGNVLERQIPLTTPSYTAVTASLGSSTASVYIWVISVSVVIDMTAFTPKNAVQFGSVDDGTENLGIQTGWVQTSHGNVHIVWGKYVAICTIMPTGAGSAVTGGWAIKRNREDIGWIDGTLQINDPNWIDDTSEPNWTVLTPVGDTLYDTDGPNGGQTGTPPPQDCTEVYVSFEEWVQWNGADACSKTLFYFNSGWDSVQDPDLYLKTLAIGSQTLPSKPTTCVN